MEEQTVDKVRGIITKIAPEANEREMYGGLVYELPDTKPKRLFAGVFKRKGYVTIEFDKGAELTDPLGVLEGTGKDRRHIRLDDVSEVETKKILDYLTRSLKQA